METQSSPRRRGRPRKAVPATVVTSQFPGIVIPITSKPRLRVGLVCELMNDCPENNGARVLIKEFMENGFASVCALGRPLKASGSDKLIWLAMVKTTILYRISGANHG